MVPLTRRSPVVSKSMDLDSAQRLEDNDDDSKTKRHKKHGKQQEEHVRFSTNMPRAWHRILWSSQHVYQQLHRRWHALPVRFQQAFMAIVAVMLFLWWTTSRMYRDMLATAREYIYRPHYVNPQEIKLRPFRFPSKQERVALYMSNWYLPPCATRRNSFNNRTGSIYSNHVVILKRVEQPPDHNSTVPGTQYHLIEELPSTFPTPDPDNYHDGLGLKQEDTTDGTRAKLADHHSLMKPRTVAVSNQVEIGRVFAMDDSNLLSCFENPWSIRFYCSDAAKAVQDATAYLSPDDEVESINSDFVKFGSNDDNKIPLLWQFSDETISLVYPPPAEHHNSSESITASPLLVSYPRIPHFKKARHRIDPLELHQMTGVTTFLAALTGWSSFLVERQLDNNHVSSKAARTATTCLTFQQRQAPRSVPDHQLQPIIWNLNIERHFGYLKLVNQFDRPWQDKHDAAIFRGMLTGLNYDRSKQEHDNCLSLQRCRLVYMYHESPLVNAKLLDTMGLVPDVFRGVNLTSDRFGKEDLLSYKGMILLEGNDVSSGLKWAMLSQSVVLMPPPTFTSWAMEEWLQPWIHYIPLRDNLTDVEEKVQWMLDHQAEAQRISYRASLWIKDLVYHPDAVNDNLWIQRDMLRRYRAHFQWATSSLDTR